MKSRKRRRALSGRTFKELLFLVAILNLSLVMLLPINLANAQVTGNFIEVKILVFLESSYHLFEPYVIQRVNATVTFNFAAPPAQNYEVTLRTFFSVYNIVETPKNSTYSFGFWGHIPNGTLILNLPGGLKEGTVKLSGYLIGRSVLYRNSVEIPVLIEIDSPVGYVSRFSLALVPPESSRVVKVYSMLYPSLQYQNAQIDGYPSLLISELYPGTPFVTLYEHSLWEPSMITFLVALICLIILIPYTRKFIGRTREVSTKSFAGKIFIFKEKTSALLRACSNTLRKLRKFFAGLNSSNFLTAYILCAFLMISLSLSFGPDPRLKVYVLSSTRENADIVQDFVSNNFRGVTITVFDEMTEFETLSSLDIFSTVIVSDFVPPNEGTLVQFIYPGLDVISRQKNGLIVLESQAYSDFQQTLQQRYGEKAVIAEDFGELQTLLANIPRRINILGMNISSSLYLIIAGLVGLSSFVIVFFGAAFLACKMIEIGRKPHTVGLLEAILYSVFVFLFTETVYIVCGTLLAMPLGLHSGGTRITAVGLLGFGGGSRPRMLFGFLGFLFGAIVSLKEGVKYDKIGFVAFLVSLLFIVLDPLTGGLIFYEFILLYTVGPYTFETAAVTMSYVREFLGSIGMALGGWVSPTLRLSTGIMLYYAGAVPFCLFPKLQKGTATLLLLFSAFSVASGGIRVSNMLPWEAMTSLTPGIIVGLFTASLFYVISYCELAIRRKLGGKEII